MANVKRIGEMLADESIPMKARYRALFTLRGIGTDQCIDEIAKDFNTKSNLLKHEMAYCLGQMRSDHALTILRSVIADEYQHVIVRHEAAEALGAIAKPEDEQFLLQYISDNHKVLAETCEIAVKRIQWYNSRDEDEAVPKSPFDCVDPAPPLQEQDMSVNDLRSTLLDAKLSMFDRYRAMFTLRNMMSEPAVLAICDGFQDDSALFRHEVAYVLGQLAHAASESHLAKYLQDERENAIVRHECAEALGAIGSKTAMCLLEKYLSDPEPLVHESCEVALDISDYVNSDQFQYADALEKVS